MRFEGHWTDDRPDARLLGEAAEPLLSCLLSAQLWFESFQNWQSEFLSAAMIVVLSIVLRYRRSPESKPVAAPHAETGGVSRLTRTGANLCVGIEAGWRVAQSQPKDFR